MGKNIFFSLSK
jgi:hypothetical protein